MTVINPYSDINWPLLLKRLTTFAEKLFAKEKCFGEEAVLPATGKSAKELALDALVEFIEKKPDWQPISAERATDELYLMLRTAIKNDFLDLVRAGRAYKRTGILGVSGSEGDKASDPKSPRAINDLQMASEEAVQAIDDLSTQIDVISIVQNEPELKEFVKAVLEEKCLKREDIAAYLGISPQEVTNRQRRLHIRLASWRRSIHNL